MEDAFVAKHGGRAGDRVARAERLAAFARSVARVERQNRQEERRFE